MGQVRKLVGGLIVAAVISSCSSQRDADRASGGAGVAGRGANPIGNGGAAGNSGGAGNSNDAGTVGESAAGASGATGGGEAGSANAGAGGEAGNTGRYSLFNGTNFSGWDRYLGKPSDNDAPLGVDNDPQGVYSVVILDSEPAIRITGEVFGSLISQRVFCNFRLWAQYKWGGAVWPPNNFKDSGIMFLSTGPLGAVNVGGNLLSDPIGSGGFLVSAEYQIAPGDVGSLYNLGPVAYSQSVHSLGQENKPSEWNDVEISLQDDVASLLLNGHEVSRASGFVLNWPNEPASALGCGKLQLQSEGAEIFFRHVEIEELP